LLKLGVIGVDHRHIYGQLSHMLSVGCVCKGWWTAGSPQPVTGFRKRFPGIPRVGRRGDLLEDPEIQLILIADKPYLRAQRSLEAMQHSKDVMSDKPGCTTIRQLSRIQDTVARTGRIWSVDYSERFEVPAVTRALEYVRSGRIGKVIQTVGLGPHRLNRATRPGWFFDGNKTGGILCDIASHQIDQFLTFTGSTDAEIVAATVANFANPEDPGLEDFGEILLRGDRGQGYIRVDWYTPDALPTWGDGRLTVLGTEGYMEIRKYVDVAGRRGTDHLFIVNGEVCEYESAGGAPLPYFRRLAEDVLNRTETSMSMRHCFKVCELAIRAQQAATRLDPAR